MALVPGNLVTVGAGTLSIASYNPNLGTQYTSSGYQPLSVMADGSLLTSTNSTADLRVQESVLLVDKAFQIQSLVANNDRGYHRNLDRGIDADNFRDLR